MIKKEVIEKISKYFRLTEFEAEKLYDEIFSIIMNGVKEDNIVDITNFGEFIIKYNNGKTGGNENGNGFKKTVEFLAASSVEEELNQGGFTYQAPSAGVTGAGFSETVPLKDKPIQEEKPVKEMPEAHEITEPLQPPPVKEETSEASIEEELRRKREEILSKITGPILPGPTGFKIEDSEKKPEPPPLTEEPKIEQPKTEEVKEEIFTPESFNVTAKEEEEEKTTESEEEAVKEVDDISRKSFSDYFSEVTPGTKKIIEEKPVEEPVKEDVIPKSAVLLHNEITSKEPPPKEITPEEQPIPQSLQQSAAGTERSRRDDSYYIWYKDSDSNPTDTQTLSYEYELLYQATKEAEYKSKLKIYVSTFILFFSIVLVLLIFSPLIYKVFFSPSETPGNIQEQNINGEVSQQKGEPNVLLENTQTQQNQTQVVPPADTIKKTEQVTVPPSDTTKKTVPPVNNQTTEKKEEKKVQQTPPVTKKETKPEQKKQPEKKEQTKQPEQQKAPQQKTTQQQKPPKQEAPKQEKTNGLSKNSLGWTDDKLKVIYVQLENGKYAIQESAWDSDAKANKRISAVESLGIPGIKGSMIKADLGAKGTWYRVRLGEFSTLDEARKKAEELRKKEKVKLQAMLFACLFLYT